MAYSLTKAGGVGQREDEEALRRRIAPLLAPLHRDRSAVLVALQKVQEEVGYLPPVAFAEIARALRVSPSEVFGAATFYAQFYLTPSGKNRIMACRGTACHVKGAARIIRAIKQHLGIEEGETTPDGEFTLETVACIGACALAPNMTVNRETFGKLTPGKTVDILAARRTGGNK